MANDMNSRWAAGLLLLFVNTTTVSQTITTIAGNGQQGYSGDGGAAVMR